MSLQLQFPDKLTDKIVEKFAGAETIGKKKNLIGVMLKNFVEKLKSDTMDQVSFKTEVIENILQFDQKKLEEFDTVLIQISEKNDHYVNYLIDCVALSKKAQFAVQLIFDSEMDYRSALSKLDYWEKESNIKVVEVFFEKTQGDLVCDGSMESNLTFSLIFGKFCVILPPLKYLNRSLDSSLLEVVSSISPPGAKIAYVATGPKVPVLLCKEDTCPLSVTYFAPKKVLDKLESRSIFDKGGLNDLDKDAVADVTEDNNDTYVNIETSDKDIVDLGDETSDMPSDFIDESLIVVDVLKKMQKQSSTSKTTYTAVN